MRKIRWFSILLLLVLLALACNVPFAMNGSKATETASSVEFMAAQTITAQQLAATGTAVSQTSATTATTAGIDATNTAISVAATAQASSAVATYAAQAAQATALAQGVQVTNYAQVCPGDCLRPIRHCDCTGVFSRLRHPHHPACTSSTALHRFPPTPTRV